MRAHHAPHLLWTWAERGGQHRGQRWCPTPRVICRVGLLRRGPRRWWGGCWRASSRLCVQGSASKARAQVSRDLSSPVGSGRACAGQACAWALRCVLLKQAGMPVQLRAIELLTCNCTHTHTHTHTHTPTHTQAHTHTSSHCRPLLGHSAQPDGPSLAQAATLGVPHTLSPLPVWRGITAPAARGRSLCS